MSKGLVGALKVKNTLAARLEKIEGATKTGLLSAGMIIERASIESTPKDTGALRNSAYTKLTDTGVEVGYTADYAPAVHEDMESRRTIGGPKFLERALREKETEALAEVRKYAKEGAK